MHEKIREILLRCEIPEDQIDSADYTKDGVIDSITMAEILIEIEDTFGIEIDGEDIIPENFKNIQTIIETVKKNGGSLLNRKVLV